MYSKRGRNQFGDGIHSYLKICYSLNTEFSITNELNLLLYQKFQQIPFCSFKFQRLKPRIQKKIEGENPCLRYIGDPDYWNIHHMNYELIGGNNANHDIFWNTIADFLSKV
jgi:hypothetical protein